MDLQTSFETTCIHHLSKLITVVKQTAFQSVRQKQLKCFQFYETGKSSEDINLNRPHDHSEV